MSKRESYYCQLVCCKMSDPVPYLCKADNHLSFVDLTNLKDLQLSSCRVTDLGVSYLRGLLKLTHLNLEGCPVTAACLEALSGLASLISLNLNRCGIYDDGCENFEGKCNASC